MSNWVSYKNGNYKVSINLDTGTKIRENNLEFFKADTAESMDVKITNNCDRNCVFCIPGSAKLIKEQYQEVEISNINIGDKVLSKNLDTNTLEFKAVKNKYERYIEEEIIELVLDSGDTLKLTGNHKVFTKNRGYIRADQLNIDDDIDIFYEKNL